jgi:hypothetical protein
MSGTSRKGAALILAAALLGLWCGASSADEPQIYRHRYGIAFPLSSGLVVYSPEHPGLFSFKTDTLFYVMKRRGPGDFILVNEFAASSEKVLAEVKSSLEGGLAQPGYRQIAVRSVKVGKNQDKEAVEHIFELGGGPKRILRQVSLVHQGKGFFFTCSAAADRFEQADKELFEPFFRSLVFE